MALENIELAEVRTRNRKDHNAQESINDAKKNYLLEHHLDSDDSLAKLSLIYGCTVSILRPFSKMLPAHTTINSVIFLNSSEKNLVVHI